MVSATIDDALQILKDTGPEFGGGLSNHGPMAAEALLALGRADAVIPWVERYKRRLQDHPGARNPIATETWREALGDIGRVGDWVAYFVRELSEARWQQVLRAWVPRLAPGLMAGATHGLIRTGHAARSLAAGETAERRHELAEGLAYWAARYQELPGRPGAPKGLRLPAEALADVSLANGPDYLPRGLISQAVKGLDAQPSFSGVIDLVDTAGDISAFVSNLTETFAHVYLANPRDPIGFIHSVTAPSALRMLAPYLSDADARLAARYAWQACAALYAWYGVSPPALAPASSDVDGHREDLIDRAVASGDEHAIKFTEACLREHALNRQPAYVSAALDATRRLGRV